MPNIGTGEILLLLLLALLLFGAKRLPEIGRSLGKGMREFKDSVTGNDDEEPAELPVGTGDLPVGTEDLPVGTQDLPVGTQDEDLPVGTQDTTVPAPQRERDVVP